MKATKINAETDAKIEQISDEDKEDRGLLLMMLEVDRDEKISREDVLNKLVNK